MGLWDEARKTGPLEAHLFKSTLVCDELDQPRNQDDTFDSLLQLTMTMDAEVVIRAFQILYAQPVPEAGVLRGHNYIRPQLY